jgi:hypothetical protein
MVDSGPSDLVGGSCFGFRVRSRCDFKFLRKRGEDLTLEIQEAPKPITTPESPLIAEWVLRHAVGDVTTRLYGLNGVFHFWTNDAGWFRIDPAARVVEISDQENEVRREQRLWGVPTVLCFMERGDFGLHAAAVEVAGGAILLAAPGRHGKRLWHSSPAFHSRGYRLLTEGIRLAAGWRLDLSAAGPHVRSAQTRHLSW